VGFRSLLAALCGVAAVCAAAGAQITSHRLPTEWLILPPAEAMAPTLTLPQSAGLTSDGQHLIVTEGGAGKPGIRILDPQTLALQRDIAVHAVFGAPLPDATGSGFWFSGAGDDTLSHADAATGTVDRTVALPRGCWAAGIARSPGAVGFLYVTCESTGALAVVSEPDGSLFLGGQSTLRNLGKHPAGIVMSPDARYAYVALWGEHAIAVVDYANVLAGKAQAPVVARTIDVGEHPEALAISRDGSRLYVAAADDDTVSIVDTTTFVVRSKTNVGLFNDRVIGASPASLALSPDGTRLYVGCAAANAVAVMQIQDDGLQTIGAIPTGWYPTAVTLDPTGHVLYIANGKGEGSHANPQFHPFLPRTAQTGYIASSLIGSVRRVTIPSDAVLARGIDLVRQNAGPRMGEALDIDSLPAQAIPENTILRSDGPIKHVIYIIKENRTFDQVLGDIGGGADGDSSLTLFGDNITPNEHAIARTFGILDRAFADAQVSADGHNWSTAAFANDYLEKMWPPLYGGRRKLYDFEDGADASVPHGGYVWNAAASAGLSYRNYGEFTSQPTSPGGPVTTMMPDLIGHTDPKFAGFDLTISDATREAEWEREFDTYESTRSLPALEIVRLPSDHTSGTRPGALTPQAMVADNDAAFGRLVDVVSHSADWSGTAIFAIEDDAQNGPDHVDDQRTTLYVVSPYARSGVHHRHYSTAGVLRTIELILGLPAMSSYDASAEPLYDAFGSTAAIGPFTAIAPKIDLHTINGAAAYRANDSLHLNFAREDSVPDGVLNDILWHAVRGAKATPPPYGLFSTAHTIADKE
jgi:YVTN family beta-propeller protein